MAEVLVTNNAVGTLSGSITNSALSLTLNSGQGALFPNPTGGDYFWATLVTAANVKEIVKVTARSTNTLTIVRAQQSTTAIAFAAGDRCELRFTAGHHALYPQIAKTNIFAAIQSFITGTFITGAAATTREFLFNTAALARWGVGVTSDAESTADAGSNFFIKSYDDAGVAKTTLFKINRATGAITNSSNNKFDAFPAATGIVFYQNAAPTGWTISAINDKALKVVSSAGGVTGGTTAFSSVMAARTIAANNLPVHTHAPGTLGGTTGNGGAHSHGLTNGAQFAKYGFDLLSGATTSFKGGNTLDTFATAADHTHPFTVTTGATGNNTTTAAAMDFDIQYASCIICTKDA